MKTIEITLIKHNVEYLIELELLMDAVNVVSTFVVQLFHMKIDANLNIFPLSDLMRKTAGFGAFYPSKIELLLSLR